MLSNSDFLMLLSQNSTDADALCELLTLSEEQRQYFTGVLPGQGLMKIGSAYVPFDGRIPAGGDLDRRIPRPSRKESKRMSGTQAHHAGGRAPASDARPLAWCPAPRSSVRTGPTSPIPWATPPPRWRAAPAYTACPPPCTAWAGRPAGRAAS